MRTRLVLFVQLVAFATIALFVSAAAAAPGRWTPPARTTTVAKPVPAWAIVPKTTAMLSGSTYPWVQPIWTPVGGFLLPTMPRGIEIANVQPPAPIPIS